MNGGVAVRVLSAHEARARLPELGDILVDCVEGGASVSFMAPMTREKATAFWRGVADGVAAGNRVLLAAEDVREQRLLGTVQVVWDMPENQPHRGDVQKMLVLGAARRRGLGAALMQAAEDEARRAGKTLLVLDTASAGAERLYERMGWQRVGAVPDYALLPHGGFCQTVFFFKKL